MPNSFNDLTKIRQQWVEINKANKFDKGIKKLLTDLYPDNAHFIYELLQNAEDSGANSVRFDLSDQYITFEHNGARLFTLKDVESITSIGVSTKSDDLTKIGQFGVGFKAVFAYTNTPEVQSGEFHFRIHDLVVPVTLGGEISKGNDKETRFIFPFDRPDKRPANAVEEIDRALRTLADNTLLFLSNISQIEYRLPDGSFGSLKRVEHEYKHIEIQTSHSSGKDIISHWLKYQKDVDVTDEEGGAKNCRIAIAYRLEPEDKKDKPSINWKIVPLNSGQVSIYFPAEKETSNLKFHMHAPFASTVARDSVRDCESNRILRDQISELVVESIVDICARGMLTMSFLAVLPNPNMDNLSPYYEPIRQAIVKAFKERPLTPTKSGSYSAASSLYRGLRSMSDVISDEDLSFLTKNELACWVANPPQISQREDRFLESLELKSGGSCIHGLDNIGIRKFEWDQLINALSSPHPSNAGSSLTESKENDEHKRCIEQWIEKKDDAWLMRFYALLYPDKDKEKDKLSEWIVAEALRIVRVDEGQEHVLPQQAFFPSEQEAALSQNIRFVKPAVYKAGNSVTQMESAVSFLEHIGVRRFDAKVAIELMLNHYNQPPKQITDDHYRDLTQFISYWKKNPDDASLFKKHRFLLGRAEDHRLYWCTPTNLCIDEPYWDTGLNELNTIHLKKVVWANYKDKLSESELKDFIEFLQSIGVLFRFDVVESRVQLNPNYWPLWEKHFQNTKDTKSALQEDYSILYLEDYLALNSKSAARLIWDALIHAGPESATARYSPNQKYLPQEMTSQLVHYLKKHAWIPGKHGEFRTPQEMTREELCTNYPYDDRNGLLTAIGFGENAKKSSEEYSRKNHVAENMGFESADEAEKMVKLAKFMHESNISSENIFEHFRKNASKPPLSLPTKPVKNAERRGDNISKQMEDSHKKTYEQISKSTKLTENSIDPTTWLREMYTNEASQMICQICKEELPFRKRDGQYYFEKKELLSSKYLPKEHESQHLALCPLCAAKYFEFIKNDDDAMKKLKNEIEKTECCGKPIEINIKFGEENAKIYFVESHFFDLKHIIEIYSSENSN